MRRIYVSAVSRKYFRPVVRRGGHISWWFQFSRAGILAQPIDWHPISPRLFVSISAVHLSCIDVHMIFGLLCNYSLPMLSPPSHRASLIYSALSSFVLLVQCSIAVDLSLGSFRDSAGMRGDIRNSRYAEARGSYIV